MPAVVVPISALCCGGSCHTAGMVAAITTEQTRFVLACYATCTTRAVCRVALSRSIIGGPGGLDLFCLTGLSPPPVLYVHLSGPVPYTIVHHDSRRGAMWRFSVLWLLRIRDTSHRGALASVMSPGKALRLSLLHVVDIQPPEWGWQVGLGSTRSRLLAVPGMVSEWSSTHAKA